MKSFRDFLNYGILGRVLPTQRGRVDNRTASHDVIASGALKPVDGTVQQRLAKACTVGGRGNPATIPWPHELLHDAVDEIDRLEAVNAKLISKRSFTRLHHALRKTVEKIDLTEAANAELMGEEPPDKAGDFDG